MNKLSIKYQVFSELCGSSVEFTSPSEFMDLWRQANNFMLESIEEETRTDTRQTNLNLVN